MPLCIKLPEKSASFVSFEVHFCWRTELGVKALCNLCACFFVRTVYIFRRIGFHDAAFKMEIAVVPYFAQCSAKGKHVRCCAAAVRNVFKFRSDVYAICVRVLFRCRNNVCPAHAKLCTYSTAVESLSGSARLEVVWMAFLLTQAAYWTADWPTRKANLAVSAAR